MDILPLVTWAHGNEAELTRVSDTQDIGSACRFLVDSGAENVIIHQGARGCSCYCERDGLIAVSAVTRWSRRSVGPALAMCSRLRSCCWGSCLCRKGCESAAGWLQRILREVRVSYRDYKRKDITVLADETYEIANSWTKPRTYLVGWTRTP